MKRILTILFCAALTVGAAPSYEISRAITSMSGQQAQFVQRFTPRGFKKEQVESGTVIFGSAPRMRWTYARPEQKVFVFDGATSWFYVPSDQQVTVNRLSDAERRELPFLLLADPVSVQKHFTVSERTAGGKVHSKLTARDAAAMVREVNVTTNARDHRVETLAYSDKQGNRTVFEFSKYTRAPAAQFTFVPPAGVQVVQQ
jgi:chaperone LolA